MASAAGDIRKKKKMEIIDGEDRAEKYRRKKWKDRTKQQIMAKKQHQRNIMAGGDIENQHARENIAKRDIKSKEKKKKKKYRRR